MDTDYLYSLASMARQHLALAKAHAAGTAAERYVALAAEDLTTVTESLAELREFYVVVRIVAGPNESGDASS